MWGKPEQATQSSIVWLTKTSPVLLPCRLQYTGHACLQLARIKSNPLLTSVDSGHTAWLVMHGSYTNKGVEKSLHITNTLSATQLGPSKNLLPSAFCMQSGLNFQPSYSKCWCSNYFSQASLLALFPTLLVPEISSQSKNVTYCPHVALNCSLSRHMEYVQQIIHIFLRKMPKKAWFSVPSGG